VQILAMGSKVFSQATDTGLPDGFAGSVQVRVGSGEPQPAAVAEVDAVDAVRPYAYLPAVFADATGW